MGEIHLIWRRRILRRHWANARIDLPVAKIGDIRRNSRNGGPLVYAGCSYFGARYIFRFGVIAAQIARSATPSYFERSAIHRPA